MSTHRSSRKTTVQYKRFDQSLSAPRLATPGAAGLDLAARVSVTIAPQSVGYVPLNIALALPPDHWALLAARSSLHKRGLMLANGIGVGDYDFRGEDDEYKAALFNFFQEPVTIERGERIVQLIVMPRIPVLLEEVERLSEQSRGGFGSTGA